MLKELMKKQLKEKRSQMENLEKALIESEDKEERAQLGETLKKVRDEITEMENALEEEDKMEAEKEQEQEEERAKENEKSHEQAEEMRKKILGTYSMNGGITEVEETRKKDLNKVMEERGKALKEKRAIKVETGKALLPSHTGTQLNDTFSQVSTLVDKVASENLQGGETYKEAFVKSYGTGGITAEGADYTEAEPEFDYAPMNKIKITAYAEITEEIKKLPNIDYAGKVEEACLIALKKKLSQQIISGTGTDQMVGIFASPIAINAAKDVEVEAIDINTLDTAVFNYGGDEDVETQATLILNKKTLKALSEVRKANGDKAYEIDLTNKTINTIPYVINSNVKDFATAANGDFVGAYGSLQSYKTVTFSPVEIMESTDFKFKQGMICFKASVFVAGNVIKQDGFLRLKKKSA